MLNEEDVITVPEIKKTQQNPIKPKVPFSVLTVVKDDKNFEAFFRKFLELQ
jgi:hypothetical protein